MTKFASEKGVEIPTDNWPLYPFATMAVGDSFPVPVGKNKESVRIAAHCWVKKRKLKRLKFKVRPSEKDPSGYRCWRVS